MKTLNEQVNRMKSLMNILTEDTEDNLDNVVEFLVRSTEIGDDGDRVTLTFPSLSSDRIYSIPFLTYPMVSIDPIKDYCKNTVGLTKEETLYVWRKYKDIIKDKINNGQ